MDAHVIEQIAAVVAKPGARTERARAAAEVIRRGLAHRWVGIYTVTDKSVVNEAWSGPGPPAFPTFARERGLTGHALRAHAVTLSNDVANDPRYLANQDDTGSELILPVVLAGRVVGTLDIESDEVGAFDGPSIAYSESCARILTALWDEAKA